MTLNGLKVTERTYHFDRGATIGEFNAVVVGTGTASFSAGGIKGLRLRLAANADSAFIAQNDALPFDIDDLVDVEFRYSIEDFEAGTDFYLGMASAYNAAPDSVASAVWFKVSDAARTLTVESDDGTTDNNNIATNLAPGDSELQVAQIHFNTGVQSVSPPSTSNGGKSDIRFSHTDSAQILQHCNLASTIGMPAYSAGLQIYVGGIASAALSGTPTLYLKEVTVRYRDRR